MTNQDLSHWVPRPRPARAPIEGRTVRLEPVAPTHADALFEAVHGEGSDPDLWEYLAYGPFTTLDTFTSWLEERAASEDPLFYAVVDTASGRAQGMVAFLRIDEAFGVIEIGHIWFGAALQRTRNATETIYLLSREAFDTLGYRRLEWKCNNANTRSKRAAERFGFTFEGVFRQHMIVKGRNRDTAWFSIVDGEWPAIRRGYERWLADDNFDAEGRQRLSLTEARATP